MTNYQSYFEKAIENNQLKLVGGKKQWRKFNLDITELVWVRNFFDGYLMHVYNLDYQHLCSVKIGWDFVSVTLPNKIKIQVENLTFAIQKEIVL